jgi:hypothetical protein
MAMNKRLDQIVSPTSTDAGIQLQTRSASAVGSGEETKQYHAPLVGQTGSKLRGRFLRYARTDNKATVRSGDPDLRRGLLDGSIVPEFDLTDSCEISLENLIDCPRPVVYASPLQNPSHYRVYDEHYLRQYFNSLMRDGRPLRDPTTRLPLSNGALPYSENYFIPAYAQGTTVFQRRDPYLGPIPAPPPQFNAAQPSRPESATAQIEVIDAPMQRIGLDNNEDLLRIHYPDMHHEPGLNIGGSRVFNAIRHFLLTYLRDNHFDSTEMERGELIRSMQLHYIGAINFYALRVRFRYFDDGELDRGVMGDYFGTEDGSIIFLRNGPNCPTFRNNRGVTETRVFLEYLSFIFHAYFHTRVTGRRIRVMDGGRPGLYIYLVPYLQNFTMANPPRTGDPETSAVEAVPRTGDPETGAAAAVAGTDDAAVNRIPVIDSSTLAIQVEERDIDEPTQRWLVRILNSAPPLEELMEMDVRQPEFHPQTREPISQDDYVRFMENQARLERLARGNRIIAEMQNAIERETGNQRAIGPPH